MIKQHVFTSLALLTLLLGYGSQTLAQDQNHSVYVDAGAEVGQALLVKSSGACYAIVPTHVVADGSFITVAGKGINPPIGDGGNSTDLGRDISVMPVDGEISLHCGPLFNTIDGNIQARLKEHSRALINIVNPDGTLSRMPVIITDQSLTELKVTPQSKDSAFMKGMSGSYVTISDKPLGILLSVNAETGEGNIIRMDRVLETISPYFSNNTTLTTPIVDASSQERIAAKVVKWTAHPIDEHHRAANLLSSSDTKKPWLAKKTNKQEKIVIELTEKTDQKVNFISLSGRGLENNKSLARQVELLIDATGNGRWKSIKAVTVPQDGSTVTAQFPARQAKKIMLKLYDNWGDNTLIGLGSVYIAKD